MFRSLPYEGNIAFAEDFLVDLELSDQIGMSDLHSIFNQLHKRLKSLKISKEEFVLMKSIVLVNAGLTFQISKFIVICRFNKR